MIGVKIFLEPLVKLAVEFTNVIGGGSQGDPVVGVLFALKNIPIVSDDFLSFTLFKFQLSNRGLRLNPIFGCRSEPEH